MIDVVLLGGWGVWSSSCFPAVMFTDQTIPNLVPFHSLNLMNSSHRRCNSQYAVIKDWSYFPKTKARLEISKNPCNSFTVSSWWLWDDSVIPVLLADRAANDISPNGRSFILISSTLRPGIGSFHGIHGVDGIHGHLGKLLGDNGDSWQLWV